MHLGVRGQEGHKDRHCGWHRIFELRFPHAATLARAPALVFVALSLLPQDHSPRRGYVSFMVSASLFYRIVPFIRTQGVRQRLASGGHVLFLRPIEGGRRFFL